MWSLASLPCHAHVVVAHRQAHVVVACMRHARIRACLSCVSECIHRHAQVGSPLVHAPDPGLTRTICQTTSCTQHLVQMISVDSVPEYMQLMGICGTSICALVGVMWQAGCCGVSTYHMPRAYSFVSWLVRSSVHAEQSVARCPCTCVCICVCICVHSLLVAIGKCDGGCGCALLPAVVCAHATHLAHALQTGTSRGHQHQDVMQEASGV